MSQTPANAPADFGPPVDQGPPLEAYADLMQGEPDDFSPESYTQSDDATREPFPPLASPSEHGEVFAEPNRLAMRVDKILAGLDEFQRQAATAPEPTLCFAGAGSGKTKTLTARVAWLVGHAGVQPDRIFAVTFTNKAAGEMRRRIADALGSSRVPPWIGTFHGLLLRLLRQAPETATFAGKSLDKNFKVIDSDDGKRLFRAIALEDPEIAKREEDRRARQKEAREAAKRVADARGSAGEHLVEDDEERSLPGALFDLVSLWKDALVAPDAPALKQFDKETETYTDPTIRDSLARLDLDDSYATLAARIYPRYQARLIEENSVDFADLMMWPILRLRNDPVFRVRTARRYDRVLVDEYQDVNPAQAELVRHLCHEHGNAFVVGDDGQSIYGFRDADIRYIRDFQKDFAVFGRPVNVSVLRKNYRSHSQIVEAGRTIVEGDERIYRKETLPVRGPGPALTLNSYQTGMGESIGVANSILAGRREGRKWRDFCILYRANILNKSLQQIFVERRIPFVVHGDTPLYASKEAKDIAAFVRLALTSNAVSDFRRVANEPKRGVGAKTIETLLDKTRSENLDLIDYLASGEASGRGAAALTKFAIAVQGLTAAIKEGPLVAFILNHPQATDFWKTTVMSLTSQGLSLERAVARVSNGETLMNSDIEDEKFAAIVASEFPNASLTGDGIPGWLSRPIQKFLDNIGYTQMLKADIEKGERRLANLVYIAETADKHTDPLLWLDEMALALEPDKDDIDAVQMMTIHRSKGLEFKEIFVVGMDEGILPSFGALKAGTEDEERRVAYVAYTRAENRLHLSHASERMTWDGVKDYEPSRYIGELPRAIFDAASQAKLNEMFGPERASSETPQKPRNEFPIAPTAHGLVATPPAAAPHPASMQSSKPTSTPIEAKPNPEKRSDPLSPDAVAAFFG
jgi:DNA helicase-2/ATP-dependent DNA helicase PcrA